jgi:hypothetical protein
MLLYLTKQSTELPVDITEVKEHLHIENTLDDTYIFSLIESAIAYVEQKTKRLLTKHYAKVLVEQASNEVYLPYGNIIVSAARTEKEHLTPNVDYVVPFLGSMVKFNKSHRDVTIDFDCGYQTIPADIKHALLMIIGTMYEQRMDVTFGVQSFKAHFSSEMLLARHKL